MRCYNCGAHLSEHDFCTNCGADVSRYKKIMMISNRFYNEGLEKANVRDLTGAINSLRQSLKFNKNNVEARNLLGLIYFETGEVVAALSEWVISKNLRDKKNIADDYIEMVQSNPSRLDAINQTIKKYNQALLYCNQDSKDLAIIQLKKVLSLNPKFVRAHQLLALLYLDAEEWEKSERELRKCMQIDTGNTMTKRYLQEVDKMLHPEEQDNHSKTKKKEKNSDVISYKSGNDLIIQPKDVKESKGVSSLLNLGIGLVIGVAIACFLILPARVQSAKAEVNEQLRTVSEQVATKSASIDELQQQMDVLKSENDDLHSQLDGYVGTDGTLETMDHLMSAAQFYLTAGDEGIDATKIAGLLEQINDETVLTETSEAFQAVYNSLLTAVGPTVAQTYYKDGYDAYKNEKFGDAIANLEKAVFYDATNGDAIFNLANAYNKNGDTENAKKYYEEVIKQFEGTERAKKAQQYLDVING